MTVVRKEIIFLLQYDMFQSLLIFTLQCILQLAPHILGQVILPRKRFSTAM